jgi:periplasmic protein TonB
VNETVVISYPLSAQGDVTEVKVLSSVDPALDKEAMRVILNMPNWIPGKQNGRNCPVKCDIPISCGFTQTK